MHTAAGAATPCMCITALFGLPPLRAAEGANPHSEDAMSGSQRERLLAEEESRLANESGP